MRVRFAAGRCCIWRDGVVMIGSLVWRFGKKAHGECIGDGGVPLVLYPLRSPPSTIHLLIFHGARLRGPVGRRGRGRVWIAILTYVLSKLNISKRTYLYCSTSRNQHHDISLNA